MEFIYYFEYEIDVLCVIWNDFDVFFLMLNEKTFGQRLVSHILVLTLTKQFLCKIDITFHECVDGVARCFYSHTNKLGKHLALNSLNISTNLVQFKCFCILCLNVLVVLVCVTREEVF